MKDLTVYEMVTLAEGGERLVIKNGFNYYKIDREELLEGDFQFKNNKVISFRYSTMYNGILIEC